MKKSEVYDLTIPRHLREYEELVNRRGVAVLSEKEFFGVGKSEDGPVPCIMRVVDYRERECDTDGVYAPPMC